MIFEQAKREGCIVRSIPNKGTAHSSKVGRLLGQHFKYLCLFVKHSYLPQIGHSSEYFIDVNSVNPYKKPRHSYPPHCKGELSHRRIRNIV